MRVVICPDKFAGTLSAVKAAQAIAEGWRSVAPGDELVLRPVADGGPGFLEVLHTAVGGTLHDVPATDPLGRPVAGQVLVVGDTAYVESAQACGLHLLAANERDPKLTTSFGLAALITAAAHVSRGPESVSRKVVVGLGGSGTNDGGAGLLSALGIPPIDAQGTSLPPGGAALAACAALGWAGSPEKTAIPPRRGPDFPEIRASRPGEEAGLAGALTPRFGARVGLASQLGEGVELVGASDVDNPLTGPHGASAVFGMQKGATAADVELLDSALANWAMILERDLPGCPAGLARLPCGGAAGGLGAAVIGLGGRIVSGIDLILHETGLNLEVAASDLVITGEGSFDHQSLRGKVIAGVAGAARDHGVPCVVLAGRVSTGRREQGAAGVTEAHALVDHFGDVERAMREPAAGLRALAARLAGQYSRR